MLYRTVRRLVKARRSISRLWGKGGREKGKEERERNSPLPSKISSPRTPKEDLILRLVKGMNPKFKGPIALSETKVK